MIDTMGGVFLIHFYFSIHCCFWIVFDPYILKRRKTKFVLFNSGSISVSHWWGLKLSVLSMGSTRFTVTGYSSRPSWLKPWSEIARKWMRRKGWHGVYYFNLVFCSSHKLAGADFCQILHFCKSTIFSVQNGYRLVRITSFPKLLTNPYSLSNYFMIMIDENFFARLVLKFSISKFFEISKNMKIHVVMMMLVVNWMQQIILEPFSLFIYSINRCVYF